MTPSNYNYKVGDLSIARVFEIKDLAVYFDVKLYFRLHVEYITSKAYPMLRFVKTRNAFRNVKSFKKHLLYSG